MYFYKSSVSVVAVTGVALLTSSGSVSASIDAVSRSLSRSSLYLIPEDEKLREYGVDPEEEDKKAKPKPKKDWTALDTRFVKDVSQLVGYHWENGMQDNGEEMAYDLRMMGEKEGRIVSDRYGLSMVGIGHRLAAMNYSPEDLNYLLKNLRSTHIYGKNCIKYGYSLKLIL